MQTQKCLENDASNEKVNSDKSSTSWKSGSRSGTGTETTLSDKFGQTLKGVVRYEVVGDWLTEYKTMRCYLVYVKNAQGLTESQMRTFAEIQRGNIELVTALHLLFDSLSTDVQIVEPVCHQLFDFYRSSESLLRRFSLELLPSLISYTLQTHDQVTKGGAAVEACLLGMYNLEIIDSQGEARVTSFRIPSLAHPSIYHEPVKISSLALTETALSKFANKDMEVWMGGPFQQHDVINNQNRESVLTLLLQSYMADIANLSPWSTESFCVACFRIAGSGFSHFTPHLPPVSGSSQSPTKRISVTAGLLVEMLSGIYFSIFNGHLKMATLALEAVHSRACYELYSDVQLVTNAIKNSLKNSAQEENGVMGISLSTITTSTTGVCKTALTNASFRAHKLPDDINVPEMLAPTSLPVIEEKFTPLKSFTVPNSKMKVPKILGRKAEKVRVKNDQEYLSSTGNMNVNSSEATDSTLSVIVAKRHSKTTIDNIELISMNTNVNAELTTNGAGLNTSAKKEGGENGKSGKPRSSSLSSSTPFPRHLVTRHSNHAINPSSTQTQI